MAWVVAAMDDQKLRVLSSDVSTVSTAKNPVLQGQFPQRLSDMLGIVVDIHIFSVLFLLTISVPAGHDTAVDTRKK